MTPVPSEVEGLPPGSTIGIIGGGQLGRMLAIAAAQLGYKCHIFAPDTDPPAGDVAALVTCADYLDEAALTAFAASVDVATYEFENLPASSLAALGDKLIPGTRSLAIAQDRVVEKRFLESCGARVARWREVSSEADAEQAEHEIGFPLVIKTRRLGYDGKGQAWAREPGGAVAAWAKIGRQPAIAEAAINFDAEFSIILARATDDSGVHYEAVENLHSDGILRRSSVPAAETILKHEEDASWAAIEIATNLDHVGVLTVEFFATAEGAIVNEIAPRVHNSGHWTIEGAKTSQFEQHIRAICGLPLGSRERTGSRVTMENLLGDDVLQWRGLIAEPGAHLHLYGKGEFRPGRKMGHVTRVTP